MAMCNRCGSTLHKDEKAVYKRLINRAADNEDLLCKKCLAEHLGVDTYVIDEKIEHFKSIGCTLFT